MEATSFAARGWALVASPLTLLSTSSSSYADELGRSCRPITYLTAFVVFLAVAASLIVRRRKCRTPPMSTKPKVLVSAQKAARAQGEESCPGCGMKPPDLRKHMKRCCPEHLPENMETASSKARKESRKQRSEEDWISEEEVRQAALQSFAAVEDPLLRQVLELRFGKDNGGKRRTPAEVADALGGRYHGNAQTALGLIRTALRSIPLVADDPKDLHVLFEDDDFLAVQKPPFLRCTPVHRFVGKSLTNQLVGYDMLKSGSNKPQTEAPMLLHRLDQTTSGVVLCAKTKSAAAFSGDHWHGNACKKQYLAIVSLTPAAKLQAVVGESILVDVPIGSDPNSDDPVRRAVNFADGQTAATRFEVLAIGERRAALLACTLEVSGRTHQIRVHASYIGAPLVGDEMYGGLTPSQDEAAPCRVALHAWRLQAPHPHKSEGLTVVAPLTEDLAKCLKQFGIEWPSTS
eukprot:TRINITY_DN80025_c0_g1_i1.p1 TRINITY_DN80025_c0_g1~~TRINITY_DN80025_c0_g1_i1.p1  ORF type:complete len:461 (-),score=78.43 TRINITY_DN80025_c0_g1_i1:152-1534(-)